ncbi:efflux RND transporter periplasmic adaptor subunit [Echinicola marina]|uniref:efflux RND transporter periplasmic adaptor subunit n=1 Tax=Echinicola marina TaxID=2859768 RepID=UPI001CF62EE4|nr:efflux RND transporter periplasmic adaptor subunit [Echinicola marina]UCS92087.1 efflux RND transporter periplasmic adaptor subunit [Echinicola marina]
MRKISRYIVAGICLLTGAFLMAACGNADKVGLEEEGAELGLQSNELLLTEAQLKANDFEISGFVEKPFYQTVKANGMLDVPPENKVVVSAYFGGFVKELKLLPGQKVQKGQVLFSLENPEFIALQQEYLETKSQIAYLKADFERQIELVKTKVSSEKKYLKAEADYLLMKSRYEALAKRMALMGLNAEQLEGSSITSTINIKAPISGYITSISTEKGKYLNSSDVALTIIDNDHLHLELNVFEKDAWKIKEGQAVGFSLQDNPGQLYTGKVHLVGKAVSEEDRSIAVHVHLDDEEAYRNFVPGMYAEAKVQIDAIDEKALPETAIVQKGEKYFVLLQMAESNGETKFMEKLVIPGQKEAGYIAVKNAGDFKEGSVFLTKGAFNLIKE